MKQKQIIFNFLVRETPDQLRKAINNPNDKWEVHHYEDESWMTSKVEDDDVEPIQTCFWDGPRGELHIECCDGVSVYKITPYHRGGSIVSLKGFFSDLMTQYLLPTMTYVPNTLQARYMDMPQRMDIRNFCRIFEQRQPEELNIFKDNLQGVYSKVNSFFQNEIPIFPR